VMLTSESEEVSVAEILEEFAIELPDDEQERARAIRKTHIESLPEESTS